MQFKIFQEYTYEELERELDKWVADNSMFCEIKLLAQSENPQEETITVTIGYDVRKRKVF